MCYSECALCNHCTVGHLKNTEVLILDAACGFSLYLVYLITIRNSLSKIDQQI